ncbi:sister chromatid cohesion protein PDS5 homolog A-B-like [Acanthaster planci]|uniref:Sister chromatid cohesion protein PDS5 homolog A-B-like n=1 Tax=Acanthaster planci TaxID=133434 RepID=A0A8B7XFK9_ACAPL|nr:sister chromatid cohesion protein PDS5 homolog A-B-like [Acanthaster planci]
MSKGKGHQRGLPQIIYPQGLKEIATDLPKDELLRRLKVLARSFQDMEQEEEVTQYQALALYLVNGGFLKHPSKDVRLLVACCIADIFRVFAPEAPYRTAEQLRTIFQFLNKQLWGLENVDGPSWKRYFYLLENLAMVKSYNICMELEDCNELFVELFNIFFSIISEHHTPKVRTFMLDVMCPLISENDAVPPDLLEIILSNLLESKKAENPHAFQMAKELIKRTTTSIEPSIQAFFNNVLILGKTSETELAGHCYSLIYQLNTISSTLLLSVLPQLEFKLKSNDERERLAVTKLLGQMFSNKDSDLASQNKALWNCFLGRFSDISTSIRTECVKFVQEFILHHSYLIGDLIEKLRARVHDTDEGVRQEVVSAISNAAKRDITNISDEMLTLIKDRTLDKKWKIRKEAVLGLAHIYKKWHSSEDLSAQERKRLSWIKDKVLHMYYQPIIEDRLLVERVFTMTLVPFTLEVKLRMKTLLHLFATVDRHAVKALIEMMKNQYIVRTHVRELMDTFKKEKEERAKLIHPKVVAISKHLPEPSKAIDHLKRLVGLLEEDLKARAAMEKVVEPKVTCRRATQSVSEVLKKFGNPSQPTPTFDTIKTLMERIAPLVIDANAIKELIGIVAEHVEGIAEPFEERADETTEVRGLRLLQTLAPVFPSAFRSDASFDQLLSMLKHEDDSVSDVALQIFIHTGQNLKEEFPNIASCLLPILICKAKTGSPSQAKHAIRCINGVLGKNKVAVFQQLYDSLQKCLNLNHEHHLTALAAVGEIAKLAPEHFCSAMKPVIANSIVKGLLMQDQTEGTPTKGIWCHDNQVAEETLAKIAAMKLLVRWLEGLRACNAQDTSPCVSTIRLLMTMIKNEGDLMERKAISKADMSRLRLAAACSMLKIAQVPGYHELVSTEHFQLLALTINDECYQVREYFARKLNKALSCLRLPLSYMAIFSLCVKDPVKESRANAKQYLAKNIQNRREYLKQHTVENAHLLTLLPEYVIPYTIHLLAHDPDFTNLKDLEGLRDTKECLWFILEPLVSKNDNCSFMRKLIETIKQMKDAQNPDDRGVNRKLYAVCDIALGLMLSKTPAFTQKEHPVNPLLPKQLFVKPRKPLMKTESVLPKKMQEEFTQQEKKKKNAADKLLETPPPKGAKASKKGQKTDPTTPTSPASPAPPIQKTPRGDENKPTSVGSRRSSRSDSVANSETKQNVKERKGSTRSRGSALAENNANSSISSPSPSTSPKKPQRKRPVQKPIKEFLTRSKTATPSSSLTSPESSPSKSPRKRPANQSGTDSPSAKKLKTKPSAAVRRAQTKVAQAKAAKAKTLAVKKLQVAASPSKSSSGSPAKASTSKTKTAGTKRTQARDGAKKSLPTPLKKMNAIKKSAKSPSPTKKPLLSPGKKSIPSPTKKAASKVVAKSATRNSSRSPVKKPTPKKTSVARLSNGSVSSPPKRSTLRRDSLLNKLNNASRPQRPPSSPQASPVRYSPRKSVLAGPLTTFQKRRAPSKPSPKKSPSSTSAKETMASAEEEEDKRKKVKRKLEDVEGSGDKSSSSNAAPSPKKLKQTTLAFNLRKTSRKGSSADVNGVAISDEDTESSSSSGRPSRHDRALVRAIEAAGDKGTPKQAQTSLSIRRSNRRRKR